MIAHGDVFVTFMKSVQKEHHRDVKTVELPIYLVNGSRIFLRCLTSDQTDDIFEVSIITNVVHH